MSEEAAYGLSAADARTFRRLAINAKSQVQNPRGLAAPGLFAGDPGALFVARVPDVGIRGRVGRKVYSEVCDIFQVVQEARFTGTGTGGPPTGTGTHSYPQFVLGQAPSSSQFVFNLSTEEVEPLEFVPVGQDPFGTWIILGGGGTGAPPDRELIRVTDVIGSQKIGTDCTVGTGTGTGVANDACGFIFHHGVIDSVDVHCQDFDDDGDCVYVFDLCGRRIYPRPEPYWADLVGVGPTGLQAVPVDPTKLPCVPGEGALLYALDLGRPSATILVGSRLGRMCPGVGTDSGDTGHTGVSLTSDQNLPVYLGAEYVYDYVLCGYTLFQTLLISNAAGCELTPGRWVTGLYHQMMPRSKFTAIYPERCLPFYITTEKKIPRAVADVRCNSGVLDIYFSSDDDCETDVELGHDAGCCDCGDGGLTGTSSSGSCWCDGKPTSNTFTVSTFSLNNGTCINCSFSPWGAGYSFVVTRVGTGCTWSASTLPDPCGGSLGASLVIGASGSATLFIGGGTHDVSATYFLASGFNCNGSNTLTLQSSGGGCGNWPATITVAP